MSDVRGFDVQPNRFARIAQPHEYEAAALPEKKDGPGYYGLPILKKPFWKWEIALYFFFEGVSAGSYVLCTAAGLRDGKRYSGAIRAGRFLSLVTLLFCPPLLIADLGRPERFHHMLRIWKKTSPMNHGAWALSGYGIFAFVQALLKWPATKLPVGGAMLRLVQRLLPERLLALLGIPFALTMISYPGVLLSTTANPVWSRTNYLGPLFAASSMSNGAAAMSLLTYGDDGSGIHHSLSRFEDVCAVAEAGAVAMYLRNAGPAARPLTRGKQSTLFVVGAIGLGIVAPLLLRRSKSKLLSAGLAPLLTLAGGAALKWSVTYAGQESALDAELASRNAPSETGQPFWGPREQVEKPGPPL